MNIDWTIHISDVAMVGGGIVAFFKIFLGQRDTNQKLLRILLGEEGKNGLVSDVKTLKHDVYEDGGAVARVRHSVQAIRLSMASRGIGVRDEDQP